MYSNPLMPVPLVLALSAFGCGSTADDTGGRGQPGTCTAGEVHECPCGGTMGTQVCEPDGRRFGPCSCDSADSPDPMGNPRVGDPMGEPPPAEDPDVRAYDELFACSIDSGWAGDSLCVTTPPAAEGFQLHYGPSDYDDPADVARFTLEPGGEINDELAMTTPNATEILYQEYHIRLRPGTHHMILWGDDGGGIVAGLGGRYIFGAQGALENGGREDRPNRDTLAPENEGVGYRLAANVPVRFNMHYVNATAEPILREGWVNIHYADPADVRELADPITFWGALGLNIPAHSTRTVGASCSTPASPVRVMSLSGHMHAHGTRFTAWHDTPAGSEVIYETYDWAEPAELKFDTVAQNPAPDPDLFRDGGHTGTLIASPGETFRYECEMVNDTDAALTFGNQTYTAEMCLLFGSYAPSNGGPWSCVSF
jgi:hypothetical protein